ncbi:MAG: GH3 auxin-responsive promoter family protein [Bacteroidales bacterium]|nr:GH3 auxin-responsive promoter family protein [Bacteroidales bacterium]
MIKKGYSAIYPLFTIEDYDTRYYALARNGLEHDITISICPSIANLLRYHQVIMDNFDEMVEEIRQGKMRDSILNELSAEDRAEVMARIQPNPKELTNL